MTKISADNILFTFGMFAILMLAYGQTFGAAEVQNNMNQLFANWPSFQATVSALTPATAKCAAWDWGCQAGVDIAHATAFIGAAIAYPGVLAGSALSRISAFGNLMGIVTFGPATALSTIPFGTIFLLALALAVVIEAFRLFRGSPTGL